MHASPSLDTSLDTPRSGRSAQADAAAPRRIVTDAPTRMFHWLFALSFAGAWLTAESEHWRLVHVTLGYTFAGLLGFRLLYALFGPRPASLAPLWRKLKAIPVWLRSLPVGALRGTVNWKQGQHLAMALAIALMLALVVPLTLSGYASFNDWGGAWGGDVLEETHEFFANLFLAIVFGHLGMITVFSLLRRQNIALPMLTGRVEGNGPSPVRHNRVWLAGLLLMAVVGFGAWQWSDAPADGSLQAGPGTHASERAVSRERRRDD